MTDDRDLLFDLLEAIAEADGTTPESLDYSLNEYVDTDAVERLGRMDATNWKLTFQVPRHEVTLSGDGRIRIDGETVREAETARSPERDD